MLWWRGECKLLRNRLIVVVIHQPQKESTENLQMLSSVFDLRSDLFPASFYSRYVFFPSGYVWLQHEMLRPALKSLKLRWSLKLCCFHNNHMKNFPVAFFVQKKWWTIFLKASLLPQLWFIKTRWEQNIHECQYFMARWTILRQQCHALQIVIWLEIIDFIFPSGCQDFLLKRNLESIFSSTLVTCFSDRSPSGDACIVLLCYFCTFLRKMVMIIWCWAMIKTLKIITILSHRLCSVWSLHLHEKT